MERHDRAPIIRRSLKTDDLAAARCLRDRFEKADNELWAELLAGDDEDDALARFKSAVRRAQALGFSYMTAEEIETELPWEELARRMEAIADPNTSPATAAAVLGAVPRPPVRLSDALRIYVKDIAGPEVIRKSPQQKRKWLAVPERAVQTFIEVIGDKGILDITRQDAQRFHQYWRKKVAPDASDASDAPEVRKVPKVASDISVVPKVPVVRPTHTASSANRQIGELRKIYREYCKYSGDENRRNPFDGLSFAERTKVKRPAFTAKWLQEKILEKGALAGLNEQARGILLVMIETGARPSEICNLTADTIHLDEAVPYIRIAEREDQDAPRELKTAASARELPLVGVALAAFRKFPGGFPRYMEHEEAASAAINKFLRENDLVPTPKHTLYSIRHGFEDRMKEAGIDQEMRELFFGHRRTRQEYGTGGDMAWRQGLLEAMALTVPEDII